MVLNEISPEEAEEHHRLIRELEESKKTARESLAGEKLQIHFHERSKKQKKRSNILRPHAANENLVQTPVWNTLPEHALGVRAGYNPDKIIEKFHAENSKA